MLISRPVRVLAAIVLGIAGTALAQESATKNPAVGVVEEFTSAYNAKNLTKLVSLYAADAVMVSETGVAEGHDAIQSRLGGGIQRGNTIAQLHPAEGESSGKLSYTEGSAEIVNGEQHFRRRYLVVVRTTGSHSEIVLHYSLPIVEKAPGS